MTSRWMICVLALVLGCSEDDGMAGDGGSGGAGGMAGTGGTAGDGGGAGVAGMAGNGGSGGMGETVPLTVQVFQPVGISVANLGPGLEGVSVCQDGTDNCVLTDELGSATIMLPADMEIAYTITKDGHISYIVWDVTDDTFGLLSTGWPLFTDQQVEDIADHLMIDYPLQGSLLAIGAVPFRAGVTFELIGETAQSFYDDEDGVGQLDLTETTSDGRGGFIGLAPGEYEVELGGNVANCVPAFALDHETPNRIAATIREGFHTYASMSCDEP